MIWLISNIGGDYKKLLHTMNSINPNCSDTIIVTGLIGKTFNALNTVEFCINNGIESILTPFEAKFYGVFKENSYLLEEELMQGCQLYYKYLDDNIIRERHMQYISSLTPEIQIGGYTISYRGNETWEDLSKNNHKDYVSTGKDTIFCGFNTEIFRKPEIWKDETTGNILLNVNKTIAFELTEKKAFVIN